MKLTIVTCVLLCSVLKPLAVTSITTSYEKLRTLVDKGDQELIQSIKATISQRLELIKNLTTVLTQRSQTHPKEFKFESNHPNDFYLLVKHHVMTWYNSDIDKSLFAVVENVIKKRNVSFPVEKDFDDAALALVRLHFVYKLKAQDMYEGNYLGYMGSPLQMDDAYLLGKESFIAGYLPLCVEWLELSADLLTKAMADKPSSTKDLTFDYIVTLSLLGRAYLYLNDREKAQKLYDQCNASGVADVEDADELEKELKSENLTKLQVEYNPSVRDIDENFTELCSRDKDQRVTAIRPYHMCRYKANALVPYQRFQEEILSTSPYASLFYDAIYDAEIEQLKEIAIKNGMYRGKVRGGGTTDYRTGDLEWAADSQHPLVARVSQRVKAFTGLEVIDSGDKRQQTAERMQVVNYGIGGHYDTHMDSSEIRDHYDARLATVLFYLSDVEKGGATIFPEVGISVSPVKGMALLWYNIPPHLRHVDHDTLHAGCPVMIGNKWISNKWIRINGNMFRRPCGPSLDSQQLDVESIVTVNTLKHNNNDIYNFP